MHDFQNILKATSSQTSEAISGEPLPILFINEHADESSKKIKLSIKNLRKIFLDPRIINSRLMIVAIDGPKKTGKSFFMNLCIRYLQKRRVESLVSNQEFLTGFPWNTSSETTGLTIYIWSEPYIIESPLRYKVAVLLLDFQGSLSNRLLIKETFAVHTFLNLLSSLLIYNIFGQIHENNLQWLILNSDYSNISKNYVHQELNTDTKSYQTLCILIRDWPYPYEFFYGSAGGQQYINRFLSTQFKNLPFENILIRQFLSAQYNNINCFLMPHPINEISNLHNFEGKWDELCSEFQEYVLGFMKNIFSPHNLSIKEVCGNHINGREMLVHIENYFHALSSADNPTPHSLFDACAKTHHYKIYNECMHYYSELMKARYLNSTSAKILLDFHDRCKILTLQKFDDESKFGFNKYAETFRIKLESQIDEDFIRFYALNSTKPVAVTHLLSVIVLSIILLFAIGSASTFFHFINIKWVSDYISAFTLVLVILLIIYCTVTTIKIYDQLNINLEIQIILRNQFFS